MSATSTLSNTLDTAESLQVIVVTEESHLRGLGPKWDALSDGVPFRTFDWAQTWWRHYRDSSSQLFTLLFVDAHGDLVGVAPWYVSNSPRHGRVVRFLGSGEVCSDYLTVLARRELAGAITERLADWLACEAVGRWNLLDLDGVEQSDGIIGCLQHRLAAYGHRVVRQVEMNGWRTVLPNTWDEFLETLSKQRKVRTRTLLRRTIDAGQAVVHHVTNARELEQAFAILIDLHQKRRQSLSQNGCFASPRFTDFHREMTGILLDRGTLRMSWIEWKGQPMAAEYSFAGGQTVYYYLGGFEPELANEQPGWLSLAQAIQHAIEDGFRAYDFLRGDESYKSSWRAVPRPLVRVRVVGSQPTARLRFATSLACEEMKGWARKVLSRTKG